MSIIRQAAFTGSQRLLKGALHCHTTRSDGKVSPEEVIRLHKQNGYDFMALTDHRNYNFRNFAPETDMLILPGMEMDSNFPDRPVHCHHIVCLGPVDGNGFAQDDAFEPVYITNPGQTQAMLDDIHACGNMTMYCHPQWSGTPASEFSMLQGNFAMEIYNAGCAIEFRLG